MHGAQARVRVPTRLVAAAVALISGVGAVVSLTLGTGAAVAATAVPPALAALDLHVTTADWTSVRFAPARWSALKVTSATAGVTVAALPGSDGVKIANVPPTGATVDIKAIYDEPTLADPIAVVVDKGNAGVTNVKITNVSAVPFTVASLSDKVKGTPTNELVTTLPRAKVFGTVEPRLPQADARRLVLAAYFPWWTSSSYDQSTLNDRPLKPYNVWSYSDVLEMTQQARANGIDGWTVSYAGPTDRSAFDLTLDAAAATGGVSTAIFETERANPTGDQSLPTDPTTVLSWLAGLAMDAGAHPSFLRAADGVPTIFVYQMERLTVAQWQGILAQLQGANLPLHLVGDGGPAYWNTVEFGWYRWDPNPYSADQLKANEHWGEVTARSTAALDPTVKPLLYTATVSPGYDDHLLRGSRYPIVSRGVNGSRYADTWTAPLANHPDWVLIDSWNEWYEGTAVQPGQANGDLALRQTATFSAQLKTR